MFRKLAAECFGTFWLVFGGCGSAVLAAGFPELGIGFAGVALAFGLTVLTMAFAVGHILVVILTRRSLLVYGLADVFRQKKSLAT
ncbi:aquaporin Z [Escherichia coli]|uniref:Aquaporin Z n=1 Tax=Escherichia coli TaxID=562 RepID=A0A376ZV95_ECOLX|nr:aquaporin Z [Escherichia coli]